jgi:hypothetical protein
LVLKRGVINCYQEVIISGKIEIETRALEPPIELVIARLKIV